MWFFGERGKPEYTQGKKHSQQSREPINSVYIRDGEGQEIKPGPCQQKVNALTIAPTLSNNVDVLSDVYKWALALVETMN